MVGVSGSGSHVAGAPRTGRRWLLPAVAAVVLMPALAACGLGDKKAMTATIIEAGRKVEEAGTLTGRFGFTYEVTETTASLPVGLSARIQTPPAIPAQIVFAENRSALLVPQDTTRALSVVPRSANSAAAASGAAAAAALAGAGGQTTTTTAAPADGSTTTLPEGAATTTTLTPVTLPDGTPVSIPQELIAGANQPEISPGPIYVYSRSTLYGRKITGGGTGRPWVRLNFADLEKGDDTKLLPGSFVPLPYNLSLHVRFLLGTLTGSVKRVGTELVEGVSTTHYTMNVDFDKATDDLEDKSIAALEKVFRANSFSGKVHKAEVWIDNQGLPKRIQVTLKQVITKKDQYSVTLDLIVDSVGDKVSIARPDLAEVAEVSSLPQLVEGLSAQ